MIQCGFSRTTRTRGSEGCGCHRDPGKRHGHLHLTFKGPEGRATSRYVPEDAHAAAAGAPV